MSSKSIPALRWSRIIPVVFLMYTIAFMDRNNIGFGYLGMQKDLGIESTAAGLAGGIFFVGYLFLQIPGGLLAEKWSARKLITIALVTWGTLALLTGFIQNLTQLLILRFFIGFIEGCVAPAVIMLLTKWFPLNERGRANSFWLLSIPFAQVIMAPICGYILTVSNWRVMFMLEAIPAYIWAVIWWIFIADEPKKAKWLSEEERNYLENTLASEKQGVKKQASSFKDAIKNKNVLLLVLVYFLIQVGYYGYGLWLPTVVKAVSGGSNMTVGYITAIPWLIAGIALIYNARHSDKTGERKWHVAVPMIIGGIFLLISTILGNVNPTLSLVALILCGGCLQAYNGIWWAIPATFLTSDVLGAAVGLINAIGNFGGFFGPFIFGYLKTLTGSFVGGMVFLVVVLIISGVLILFVRYEEPTKLKQQQRNPINKQM